METSKKSFIDFIVDVAGSEGFNIGRGIKEMILKGDPNDLQEWFRVRGYLLPTDECEKLVGCKDDLETFKSNINAFYY